MADERHTPGDNIEIDPQVDGEFVVTQRPDGIVGHADVATREAESVIDVTDCETGRTDENTVPAIVNF